MSSDTSPAEFYCPLDDCEYSAPTERQVRSHITFADHDEHDSANGYSVAIDVPDSDDHTHEYVNKLQIDEVELSDITADLKYGKAVILKLAHDNPTLNYKDIHKKAQDERIDYSYGTVRELIQTHVEDKPLARETDDQSATDPSGDGSTATESMGQETDSKQEPFDFGVDEFQPFSASPFDDSLSSEDGTGTASTSGSPSPAAHQADQSAPEGATTQSAASEDAIQLDRSNIPDYWNPKHQTIIATYEALNEPTAREVQAHLPDETDHDPALSYVASVLTCWKKDSYDELTPTQQDAIDALVNKTDTETFKDIAEKYDVKYGTLKYVHALLPHILDEQTDTPVTRSRSLLTDPLPFDTPPDVDATAWTPLQETIISCYEAHKPIRNREVHAKLEDHGISVTRGTIQQTLSEYTDDRYYPHLPADKKTYEDLRDPQQRAVDHIAREPPDTTIQHIADHVNESDGYLYHISNTYNHIINSRREDFDRT